MNLKTLLVAGAAALALSGIAIANPIQTVGPIPGVVIVDPADLLNTGFGQTGSASQQVCPEGARLCLAGNPFQNPANNLFGIVVLNNGVLDATVTTSTAFTTAVFQQLQWILRDAANNIIGQGNLLTSTIIDDVFVTAGNYTMEVLYTYNGTDNAGSARWSMAITTAAARNVPEPGTLALMGLALAGIGLLRRRT